MEDLFACKWWELCSREELVPRVENKLQNNHIVSLTKVIEGLSAVVYERLEVNMW